MRRRSVCLLSQLLLVAIPAAMTGCWTHNNCVADDSTTYVQVGPQRLRVHVTVDPSQTSTTQPAAAGEGQRLLAVDEQNRALLARIHELEAALQEKEQALTQTNGQVQTAAQDVAHARQELQRLKQNMSVLRDRLSASEKENLKTLQSIVSSLEENPQTPAPTQGMMLTPPASSAVPSGLPVRR